MKKTFLLFALLTSTAGFAQLSRPVIAPSASDPATCPANSLGELNMYYNTTTHSFKPCTALNTWGASWGASIGIPNTGVLTFGTDTGLSRDSAGVIDIGNGTQGNKSGILNLSVINNNWFLCDFYATVKACVDAMNLAGGGRAVVSLPGTYTVASTINVGVNSIQAKSVTASESGNTVTFVPGGTDIFPLQGPNAYTVGTVFSVSQCSVSGYNTNYTVATVTGTALTATNVTGSLGAATGCQFNNIPNTARGTLVIGPGVTLNCTMTDGSDCIDLADDSGVFGYNRLKALNSSTGTGKFTGSRITLASSAVVTNVIGLQNDDGVTQQGAWVDGVDIDGTCSGSPCSSGSSVVDAFIYFRGAQSGSAIDNVETSTIFGAFTNGTFGVLISQPSNTAITPTTVVGNGATATITVPLKATTIPPDSTRVKVNSFITLASCSIGAFNSTWRVKSVTSDTIFVIDTTANGSPTTCTYTVTTPLGKSQTAITSVVKMENLVINGSGVTKAHPWGVANSDGGGTVETINCDFCNLEGADTGTPECEINGNGQTGSGAANNIYLNHVHLEPQNGDTSGSSIGCKFRDAHNVGVVGVTGSGCTSCAAGTSLFDISQSASNKTYNINLDKISASNWPNTIKNNINGVTDTRADIGQYVYGGIATGGVQAGGIEGLDLFPGYVPTVPTQGEFLTPATVSGKDFNEVQYYDGATTADVSIGCMPGDTSTFCLADDFTQGTVTAGTSIVTNNFWAVTATVSCATQAWIGSSAPNYGIFEFITGAVQGDGCSASIVKNSHGPLGSIGAASNVAHHFIFNLAQTTDASFRIGYNPVATAGIVEPTDGVYLRYEKNSSAGGNTRSISGVENAGNTLATFTSTTNHGYHTGNSVTQTGFVTNVTWNTTCTLTVVSNTVYTCAIAAAAGNNAEAGGTAKSADTTWVFETRKTSVSDALDTGLTPNTANFYHLRIRNISSGKVGMTIYDNTGTLLFGEKTFCSSGCDVTTSNVNTGTEMAPFFTVFSATGGAGSAQTMKMDYWAVKVKGLAR